MTEKKRYFITVDRCNTGKRGLLCNRDGESFSKETPHTEEEMNKYLGAFFIILNPKSEPFTETELRKFNKWKPLAEYQNHYGIATEGK
jgi:hypothetical protein